MNMNKALIASFIAAAAFFALYVSDPSAAQSMAQDVSKTVLQAVLAAVPALMTYLLLPSKKKDKPVQAPPPAVPPSEVSAAGKQQRKPELPSSGPDTAYYRELAGHYLQEARRWHNVSRQLNDQNAKLRVANEEARTSCQRSHARAASQVRRRETLRLTLECGLFLAVASLVITLAFPPSREAPTAHPIALGSAYGVVCLVFGAFASFVLRNRDPRRRVSARWVAVPRGGDGEPVHQYLFVPDLGGVRVER